MNIVNDRKSPNSIDSKNLRKLQKRSANEMNSKLKKTKNKSNKKSKKSKKRKSINQISKRERKEKSKKKISKKKTKSKQKSKNTKKNSHINTADDDRLVGAALFPVDFGSEDRDIIPQHPWACSLRTRGFRGRHRCGVTLLSGPTYDYPDDPFVLVGAAHCNHICKDRNKGHVLETCCCRPPGTPGSCAKGSEAESPFCTGTPINTLAEPDDLVIVCGEFDSGVQIISQSYEKEEVF